MRLAPCQLAHHAQEGVVHVPFLLLEVIWYHRRHCVGAVGAMRPVAVAAHHDEALRTVADEPVAALPRQQHAARVVHVGIPVFYIQLFLPVSFQDSPFAGLDIFSHDVLSFCMVQSVCMVSLCRSRLFACFILPQHLAAFFC